MNGENKIYFVGDTVPEEGEYVCVPCGYHSKFKKGDIFPECISCLNAHKDVNTDELTDEGAWEKYPKY